MTERLPNTDETAWNLILDPWLLLEHNTDGTHKFSGTPTGSKFLRDDRVWAAPPGAAGSVFFNVVDYGAVGTADDSTTMGDALTAAAGQTLVFPPGTYIHQNVTVPANTTVVLMRGATLKLKASAGSHGLLFSNAGASLIGPGTLDGNRANQSGNVMPIFISAADCAVRGVTVTESNYHGIHAQTCNNVETIDCKVSGTDQAAIFIDASSADVENVRVSGCNIDLSAETAATTQAQGIHVYSDGSGGDIHTRVRVTNNDVILPTSPTTELECIVVTNGKDVVITENTTQGGGIGISGSAVDTLAIAENTVTGPDSLGIEFALGTSSSVTANTIDGSGLADYGLSITKAGANPAEPVENAISANTVKGCLSNALRLSNGDYCAVTGNTFSQTAASAVVHISDSDRCTFNGNTLTGAGTATRGLVFQASKGSITGNSFHNFTTSGVHFVATSGTIDYVTATGNTFETCGTPITTDFTGGAGFGNNVRIRANAGVADMDPVAVNTQTNDYTLVLTDSNKVVEMNKASGVTLTVPFDSSVHYPVGTEIPVYQAGAGQVTIGTAGTAGSSPLAAAGSDTDATSYATASYTPGTNKLQLLSVLNSRTGALPTVPTATGNGLTWVQVATIPWAAAAANQRRVTVFRALGASPTAGVITIDFGGVTQSGAQWQIAEFTNVPTSGSNGSGAVIQSSTATVAADGQATSVSGSLSAFGSSANRTFAAVGHSTNEGKTPRASWTELRDPLGTYGVPAQNLETQWSDAAGADTTASATWASTSYAGIIAIEVATFAPTITSLSSNRKITGQGGLVWLRNRAADDWALAGDLTA